MAVKYLLLAIFMWHCDALSMRERGMQRRGELKALWNLEKMTECHLHYSALTNYNDYGCWCGPGGAGTPVDEIDHCCMNHDHCYDAIVDNKVCFDVAEEYIFDYTWSCLTNGTAVCSEDQSKCQQYLCWCDKTVVECWGDYSQPQSKKSCPKLDLISNQTAPEIVVESEPEPKAKDAKSPLAELWDSIMSAWLYIPTRIFI